MTSRPLLGQFYGRQAAMEWHSRHWAGPPEMVDGIASVVATQAHHQVLDVGCGVGGPARRLAEVRGCRVVALDVLPAVAARANRAGAEGGRPGAPVFLAASAPALPFPPATFDQLWSLGALAHFPDLAAFTREAFRVLRAGGVICLTEAFWAGRRVPRFAATAPEPWRPVTAAGLAAVLAEAGFGAVQHHPWPGGHPPARASDAGLEADFVDGILAPAMVVAHR